MGIGCIDPCFLDLGARWRWVVCFTPLPLYPQGKSPYTHWIRGCVGPRAGLDAMDIWKFLTLLELELRPLGHPACSQSLHWLELPQLWGDIYTPTVHHKPFCCMSHKVQNECSSILIQPMYCYEREILSLLSHSAITLSLQEADFQGFLRPAMHKYFQHLCRRTNLQLLVAGAHKNMGQ
jgi:hypothetical protein